MHTSHDIRCNKCKAILGTRISTVVQRFNKDTLRSRTDCRCVPCIEHAIQLRVPLEVRAAYKLEN